MADSFLPVYVPSPALSTGSKLDSESLTVGANTVERERMQVAGASALEIARVMATTPAGTEMGVVTRLASPIPAGTSNIGDVDVLSVIPGTSGTSLGKAVGATAGANDTGVAGVLVRTDTLVTLTPTDGQYTYGRTDSLGSQWVTLSHAAQAIGSVAHDSADTQQPVKIGGYASAALRTAVTEADRVDGSWDLQGQLRVLSTGSVAHDGVDSGNPLKVGFRAVAHGTNPTAVTEADRTDWISNRHGVPWVIGGHPNVVTIEAAYTAAQTDTAIVTIATGLKLVVTQCAVICANTNTVDVAARVGFGAANTPTTTGVVLTHPGIAPGSGFTSGEGGGILGVGADGEDLRITCSVPTGGSVRALVSYYEVAS